MFDKRLLALIPQAKAYIAKTVIFKWFALLGNIAAFMCLGIFLQGILQSSGAINNATAAFLSNVALSPQALLAVFAFAIILRTLCSSKAQNASTQAGNIAKKTIRELIYDKLLRLGPCYSEQIGSSQAVQIGVEGVEQLEMYFGSYLPQFFYALLAPLTLFVVFLPLSPLAALVLLVCVPLIPASIMMFQKLAKRIMKAYWGTYLDLGATFLENVQGLTTLKLFQADESRHCMMNQQAESFRKSTMSMLRMQLNSITIMDILAYGGAAVGSILAIYQFISGNISFAGAFTVLFLSSEFFLPMRALGSLFHTAMNGMSAADKMFELLSAEEPASGDIKLEGRPASIEFSNVSYSYDGARYALKNVDFCVMPGQFIGLVGQSGSGKTTLAGILAGRNRRLTGQVLVGGIPLAEISRTSLMNQLTVVSYNSMLFAGTLRDNLQIACEDTSDTQLIDALQRARAWDFCKEKGGLDFSIKEGASNLSGGQRQRIAIARALLHDTPIMLFDEASSSIDAESEQAVLDTTYDLVKSGKTIIMITHRLRAVRNADMIYVLEAGECVQRGNHQQLMADKGAYRTLVEQQETLERYTEKDRDTERVLQLTASDEATKSTFANSADAEIDTETDETENQCSGTTSKDSSFQVMARMIHLVKPLTGYLLLAVVLGTVGFGAAMLITIISAQAITLAASGQLQNPAVVAIALALCALFRGPLRYGEQICNHFIAFKLLALIRDRVFAALRRLALAKLEGRNTGNLVSLMTSDIELLEVFYAHTISPVAIASACFIVIVTVLAVCSPAHALLAAIAYLLLGLAVPRIASSLCSDLGRKVRDSVGAMNSFMLEILRGITETVQFSQEAVRKKHLRQQMDALNAQNARLKKRGAQAAALIDALVLTANACSALLAFYLVGSNKITVFQAITAQAIIMSCFGPFIAVADLGTTLQQTLASGTRVLGLLDEKPETLEVNCGKTIEGFSGALFNQATFSYRNTKEPTLHNIDLTIKPGEVVQISGESGCGKSTLCKLLLRVWDPQAGTVYMNGVSLSQIKTESLRQNQSYLSQTTHLFQGTIRDNLLIAKPNAAEQQIWEACKKADIDALISSLPKKLDTKLGELGDSLSGGERQRIGLARIFLHDAELVILDEPTSNLDSLSEAAVLRALQMQKGTKTMVLVSHRASTSSLATRVFLLRQHLAANLICNSSERRDMTIGVMLINTGTPDAPTIEAIKPYLSEFLMDPYIIGAPYPIRKAIVSHIVSKRPEHTVENYRAFWTPAGSPFLHTSEQQAHLLQEALNSNSDNRTYRVVLAMRYGNPSISLGLEALRQEKCTDIVLLPLYPQNVKVCAGSCFKEARKQLKKLEKQGWKPCIHKVQSFHDIPAYRNALKEQISQYWTCAPGSKLIVSFHSTLLSDIKKDPTYLNQCRKTREWIANDLGLPSQDVILSFQSRFDSRAWLSPFTEQVVKDQLDQGASDICVVCPGFVADNIETTIEINRDLRNYVENAFAFCSESKGGKAALNPNRSATFTYVPALGCNPGLIEALRIAVTNATDQSETAHEQNARFDG